MGYVIMPEHVHLVVLPPDGLRLGIEIGWNEPYKICDLRLGWGTIFRDHVADYDFFGWGDIDVIYGDLRKFLTNDVLDHDIVSLLTGIFNCSIG